MRKTLPLLLLALLSMSTFAQGGRLTDGEFSRQFDAYIRAALEKTPDVPGLTIAVVRENKPIFIKSYGVADRATGLKANDETLFYIASSTKSYMALAAAILDREGKIKLSDPITKYARGLNFKNAIPDKVTVRDLLTHTSGLDNWPLTFRLAYSGDSGPDEMARLFAAATTYNDSAYGKYKYDNLGYNIYAILLRNYLNKDWREVLREKVFDPIGMKHTTAYLSQINAKHWPHAEGYVIDAETGSVIPAPIKKVDSNMQSAGGIYTTAADAARWLEVNMNDGRVDGKQVIPTDIIRAAHTGYTQTVRDAPPFVGNGEYGLGWQIGKYKEDKVIYHHGGFTGYRSHISFMPDKKIGVAVFVNNDFMGSRLADLFATYAYDALNGMPGLEAEYSKQLTDAIDQYGKSIVQMKAGAASRAARKSQLTMPLSAYVGSYKNEYFGTMDLSEKNGGLLLKMGVIELVPTAFTQKETVRVELVPGQGEVIKFNVENGKVVSLTYNNMVFTKG
ncbi:MAG: serine hydrolase [Acidobacteria bacterium]|nr:serine hydrolase [Acidobacteriota bacterium]